MPLPIHARFRHSAPDYLSDYERILGLACHFGASENALVGPASILDAPLPGENSELQGVLTTHAENVLAQLPSHHSFALDVRNAIARGLASGNVGSDAVAESLGINVRTLRRRLISEGTGFREVVDDVRCSIAKRSMLEGLPFTEVSFIVGFSDPSAFGKAFRRWTGTSPGEFIQQHR